MCNICKSVCGEPEWTLLPLQILDVERAFKIGARPNQAGKEGDKDALNKPANS